MRRAAEKVSKVPLELTVEVKQLKGILAVNIPPPPSDTIWWVSNMYMYMYMYMYRQLIFLWKSNCLGCIVLLCFVVCIALMAFFFLPSVALINMYMYNVQLFQVVSLVQE